MNSEINSLHQPELTSQAESLWNYLDRVYGVPTVELWETLNEKAHISIDYWNTILPRFRRQSTNIALISSLLIGSGGNQNVIAQDVVADDTSTNVVCLSDQESRYCYYMAIALKIMEGPALPTPAPTPRPTLTPTPTATATPMPTATPLPVRWYKDKGDSDGSDCGVSGCAKIIYFDQLDICHPVTPVIDDMTSNYLGNPFNTYPDNYRPVLTFHSWDGLIPGFKVDKEFNLFVGFNKQPSDYELIVNCGGANN